MSEGRADRLRLLINALRRYLQPGAAETPIVDWQKSGTGAFM